MSEILISYVSPVVVAMAVVLFYIFIKIQFPEWIKRVLAVLSPLSFSVYLIHECPYLRPYAIEGKFAYLTDRGAVSMVLTVLASMAAIYLGATATEMLRRYIFRVCGAEYAIRKAGEKIEQLAELYLQ